MKKFTFLIALFLLVAVKAVFAQKVAVIGMNHDTSDGFSFVAIETIPVGEIIYFTDNEYSDAINKFTYNGAPTGEGVVKFTVTSALSVGDVFFVTETSNNNEFIATGSGGSGTAEKSSILNQNFSLPPDGDNVYAYSDMDDDPTNGITKIYSVLYTGSGEAPVQNGGLIPADANPVGDFPDAIVVDGFTYSPTPARVEYNPVLRNVDVNTVNFNITGNWTTGSYADLSIVPFVAVADPSVSVAVSPSAVLEDGATNMVYTFTLSETATTDVIVNFSVGGTAVFSSDYAQTGATTFLTSSGTIVITNGTTSKSVTINPVTDTDLETNETVVLTVNAGTGYVVGSPISATGTITNDDVNNTSPLVAFTGINHNLADPDGISFAALNNISNGTIVYFTDNSFNNSTLAFMAGDAVLQWTAGGSVLKGEVIYIKETTPNTFSVTRQGGGSVGTIAHFGESFNIATTGETCYAYEDDDTNPVNGITAIYSAIYTGNSAVPGGNIPSSEDPTTFYTNSILIDGFPAIDPNRTEYDPLKRVVDVSNANFPNLNNWLHAQTYQDLSAVPFVESVLPSVTVSITPSSVLEDGVTSMEYTFTLSEIASNDLTVYFDVSGTATLSTDYTETGAATFSVSTGTVVILSGNNSATVTIDPIADPDLETNETVILTVSPGSGYVSGSPSSQTGTITNDDANETFPKVAITGLNHLDPDGFSFVAANDIPANTKIYFTDKSFNTATLLFGPAEAVVSCTSPGSVIPSGDVIVVTETAPLSNSFSLIRSGGTSPGSITMESGDFALGSNGETFYAYSDNDNDPTNGVTNIYSVFYTGNGSSSGGTIPSVEDPSGLYVNAMVVDGFPATQPNRTEYDPTKRNVLVGVADFENTGNWLFAQGNQVLSEIPFTDLQITDVEPPVAVCLTGLHIILEQLISNSPIWLLSNRPVSQSFTAPSTTDISRIDIGFASTTTVGDVILELYSGNDPNIPGSLLGTAVVTSLNANNEFVTFILGSPVPVTLGDQLHLKLQTTGYYNVQTASLPTPDPYAGGTFWTKSGASPWSSLSINDLTFKVYEGSPIYVYLDNSGSASITAEDFDGGSTDNIGIVSYQLDKTSFDCSETGDNIVTLTVTDAAGNTDNCVSTVTVVDDIAPTIACPANITVSNDPGQCGAVVNFQDIAADNCSGLIVTSNPASGSFFPIGTTTVYCTATDASGNTDECNFTVTVNDDEDPSIVCPSNIIAGNAAGQCGAFLNYTPPVGVDNCPGAITTLISGLGSGALFPVGITTETYLVTDAAGNTSTCSFTVTVNDMEDPVIVCPADIIVNNDAGQCGAVVNYTPPVGVDNCPGAITTLIGLGSGVMFPVGVTTVTYLVSDAVGNIDDCSFTVTVNDTEAPEVDCKDFSADLDINGEWNISETYLLTNAFISRSDNCNLNDDKIGATGPVVYTCDNIGANSITLTSFDYTGNQTTCTVTLTINDPLSACNQPPVAVCRDITVEADNNCENNSLTAADFNGGSTDPDNDPLTFSVSPEGPYSLGITNVVLTVTDPDGASSSCSATVNVVDFTAPVALCKDVTVQLDANGNAAVTAATVNNNSYDNCGIALLSLSQTAFDCSDVGPNPVTLTVTDNSSNSSVCYATVTVEDNVAPVALCQDVTVQLDANGNAAVTAATVNNNSYDNCGIALLSLSQTAFDCSNVGPNPVTLTVTDNNGNSSACNAIVTVVDNTAPVALCQNVTVQLDASGNGSTTPLAVNNGSNDACGIASLSLSPTSFDCSNVGPNPVTLTVSDNNGNSSACTAIVTVVDNTAPVALCQDVTVQLDANGNGSTTAAAVDNGSNDACGIASLSLSPSVFDCSDVGQNQVTLTVTDNNGNTSVCTAIVTVEDNVAPVVVTKDITVQLLADGTVTIAEDAVNDGSSDACGGLTFDTDITSFTCADVDNPVTVTLVVTDVNNNSASGTAVVTVIKRPTIVTNLGVFEGQYSDEVTLSATLFDAVSNLPLSGRSITFMIGSQSETGTTDATGKATVNIVLNQDPGGTYTIKAEYTGDCTFIGNFDEDDFDIQPENANVEYVGVEFQATAGSNSSEAMVELRAVLQSYPDGAGLGGDIRNACVSILINGNVVASGLIPELIDPSDLTTGVVVLPWNFDIGSADYESYDVKVIAGCYFVGEDQTVVTVYKPVGDFITGGGNIKPTQSAGTYASTPGLKTNFGFHVKFNKKGKNLIGGMNIIFRQQVGDEVQLFQIKTNAMSSLGINIADPNKQTAEFASKANLKNLTTGESYGGNLTLQVKIIDRGEPGTNDEIAITLWDGNTLLYSSEWTGLKTDLQYLVGGNTVVHAGFSLKAGEITTGISQETSQFEVDMYPNPTRGEVTLKITASEITDSEVIVRSITGSEVFRKEYKATGLIKIDLSEYVSGIYLVMLQTGDKSIVKKLILDRK